MNPLMKVRLINGTLSFICVKGDCIALVTGSRLMMVRIVSKEMIVLVIGAPKYLAVLLVFQLFIFFLMVLTHYLIDYHIFDSRFF